MEIVKSEDRQDHDQQKKTKDRHSMHNTTLKTKARVTQGLLLKLKITTIYFIEAKIELNEYFTGMLCVHE